MKKKDKKTKKEKDISLTFFGFLIAYAMMMGFFMFRKLLEFIPESLNLLSFIIPLIIYIVLLYASYYYSEFSKELRKNIFWFSIIIWIAYFGGIVLNSMAN